MRNAISDAIFEGKVGEERGDEILETDMRGVRGGVPLSGLHRTHVRGLCLVMSRAGPLQRGDNETGEGWVELPLSQTTFLLELLAPCRAAP